MTLDQTLIAIAACITALTVIAIFVRRTVSFIRKTVRFFDDWLGTDDEPGFAERLKLIEKDLKDIHNEVTYNSGSSLKDAVRRIEDYQKVNHKRIETIEDHLTSRK